jgi:hypothetical protein
LDPSLAARFGLTHTVAAVNGYYGCPVPDCLDAYYAPDNLATHLESEHLPDSLGADELLEFKKKKFSLIELMLRVNCRFDMDLRLFICKDEGCLHALDPISLRGHLKWHGHNLSAFEFRAVRERLKPLGPEEFFASNPLPFRSVAGIELCQVYMFCKEVGCGYKVKGQKSMEKHFSKSHPGKPVDSMYHGFYQSVFGSETRFRRVLAEGESLNEKGDVTDSKGKVVFASEWGYDIYCTENDL